MERDQIIDISHWMEDFTFDDDQAVEISGPFNRVGGSNPEYVYDLRLCTQSGTHVQGPHYFWDEGPRLDTFPLSAFEGPAVMVDVESRGANTSREELEQRISKAGGAAEILVLRSGHMDRLLAGEALLPERRPGLSMEAARYIAEEAGFKMVAIDSVGVESRITRNYEVNVYFCRQGMLILEGLVNLSAIKTPRFILQAFPLKLRGVEGTPCRAVARVSE